MRPIEPLETRRLLASFTASSVVELVSDINAANAAGGSNTITLTPGTTFKLNAVDNATFGPTGLPVIAAGDELTIVGNGDAIERSTGKSTPAFRLLAVEAGGSLALSNLTLSNGLSVPSDFPEYSPRGGAVRSDGTLSLSGVTVQNCAARGDYAYGGGIYSSGTLAVVDSAVRNNEAHGADGGGISYYSGGSGGSAFGGGLYVAGGTATLINTTFSSNVAQGGNGGSGGKVYFFTQQAWVPGGYAGSGVGGAICAAAGTLELRGTTITQNAARGGIGGSSPKGMAKGADGAGVGGGIYIAAPALVSLDPFTYENTRTNSASTSHNDIFGSFTIPG